MAIVSFSPLSDRASGLSVLLAPVQAFVALFMPRRPAPTRAKTAASPSLGCRAPSLFWHPESKPAANDQIANAYSDVPVHRLKIVRHFEPGVSRACSGRLVISGRLSDVCAELDRMADPQLPASIKGRR